MNERVHCFWEVDRSITKCWNFGHKISWSLRCLSELNCQCDKAQGRLKSRSCSFVKLRRESTVFKVMTVAHLLDELENKFRVNENLSKDWRYHNPIRLEERLDLFCSLRGTGRVVNFLVLLLLRLILIEISSWSASRRKLLSTLSIWILFPFFSGRRFWECLAFIFLWSILTLRILRRIWLFLLSLRRHLGWSF